MFVANVLARLEADATNMVRNVMSGAKSFDKLVTGAEKSSRAVDKSMSSMEKSVSKIEQTAKKAGAGVGASMDKAAKAVDASGKKIESTNEAVGKSFDRSTAAAGRTRDALGRFTGGPGGSPVNGLKDIGRELGVVTDQSKSADGGLQRMLSTSLKLAGAVGIMRFFSEAISGLSQATLGYNQNLEQAMIGMTTMLGDASKATKFMDEMQDFAAKTPFSFQGLVGATQNMMALGFEAEEVLPNLRAVGDATAAARGRCVR
jgi:hypothetical protein